MHIIFNYYTRRLGINRTWVKVTPVLINLILDDFRHMYVFMYFRGIHSQFPLDDFIISISSEIQENVTFSWKGKQRENRRDEIRANVQTRHVSI